MASSFARKISREDKNNKEMRPRTIARGPLKPFEDKIVDDTRLISARALHRSERCR